MIKINLEIADTPALLAQGLMNRQELPENNGMLFKFESPMYARFWGKNTYIPLDIAFVNRENKISSIKNIAPMSTRTVSSDDVCLMAIEVNQGFFSKNNIKPGSKVSFVRDKNNKEVEVYFGD